MAISDWETPPAVEGVIVNAIIDEIDTIRVKPIDVSDDIGNLIIIDDVFLITGKRGTLKAHGYTETSDIIGKKCLLYSNNRFDIVSIEPEYRPIIWIKYI